MLNILAPQGGLFQFISNPAQPSSMDHQPISPPPPPFPPSPLGSPQQPIEIRDDEAPAKPVPLFIPLLPRSSASSAAPTGVSFNANLPPPPLLRHLPPPPLRPGASHTDQDLITSGIKDAWDAALRAIATAAKPPAKQQDQIHSSIDKSRLPSIMTSLKRTKSKLLCEASSPVFQAYKPVGAQNVANGWSNPISSVQLTNDRSGQRVPTFICGQCRASFPSLALLSVHVKSHDKKPPVPQKRMEDLSDDELEPVALEFTCKYCRGRIGHKFFWQHRHILCPQRPIKCFKCCVRAPSREEMLRHNRRTKCGKCGADMFCARDVKHHNVRCPAVADRRRLIAKRTPDPVNLLPSTSKTTVKP